MLSREKLTQQLRDLGMQPGDRILVHASLRKIGPVQDGAEGIIRSLLSAIGKSGTLLMVLGSREGDVFVADESPADPEMGVLAEEFRKFPGASVSDHAAARFCGLGPQATELLKDPPLHHYYDRGSTLERFTQLGGRVLRLGADLDTTTLTHFAEYLANVSPKRQVKRRYQRKDIGEQWIESLDDCHGIQDWPGGDYFSQILKDFLHKGLAKIGKVGQTKAELFEAPIFVKFATNWMENNLTHL